MTDCVHYWILGQRRREGELCITHERCCKCGGERDLVENWSKNNINGLCEKKYTPITYPEKIELKEDEMPSREGRKKYFDDNREAILADFKDLTDAKLCKKWEIPSGTWTGLKRRWGIMPPKKSKPEPSSPSSVPVNVITSITPEYKPPVPGPAEKLTEKLTSVGNGHVPIEVVEHLVSISPSDERDAFWLGYLIGRGLKKLNGKGEPVDLRSMADVM